MGFLSPWFLGGLLALGVPVFVHLLRRHITVPRPVGSLMFFERGTQSSTRHRRLKYLLLFALRAALLLLVVLAFANPYLRRTSADASGRLLLLVVDNSFSMRAGTRFADAQRQALQAVTTKPAAQRAQIIALGGQVQVLTQPITDAAQLRSALEGLQPGDGHASYGELARTLRSLHEVNHQPADVHLFTDLQKSSMPPNFADMVPPNGTALILHAAATQAAPANWTVSRVEAPSELADPNDPKTSRARATITGYNTPAVHATVDLLINQKVVATRQIDVAANGNTTVEFSPLAANYGFNRCEIRITNADAFAADNVRRFTVRRSDPQKVLFLHGASDTRSELYYAAALTAAAHASFTLQSTSAAASNDLDPSRFAFVVLADTAELPPIFERNLEQYVSKGGSVFLALGPASSHGARIPLWGTAVQATRTYPSASPATVGSIDFTHPALQDAQPGRDNGGWSSAKIYYAPRVDGANARTLATLNDGTPLLLERSMGEGHLLLLATGLDNLTNDLPLHPVFIAFVDRAARYLSGAERLGGSRPVDSILPLRTAASAASVQITDPDGRPALSLSEARTAQTVRLGRTGFYSVQYANGRNAVLGVNADPLESDLTPMPQDLQQMWAASTSTEPEVATATSAIQPGTQRQSLWWYGMLLALLVAVAEVALSGNYMDTEREDA